MDVGHLPDCRDPLAFPMNDGQVFFFKGSLRTLHMPLDHRKRSLARLRQLRSPLTGQTASKPCATGARYVVMRRVR